MSFLVYITFLRDQTRISSQFRDIYEHYRIVLTPWLIESPTLPWAANIFNSAGCGGGGNSLFEMPGEKFFWGETENFRFCLGGGTDPG